MKKKNDRKIDKKFKNENWTESEFNKFFKPKKLTAANVGIDSKNDILAESTLLNFRSLAAVIAIPDLLTPGISENTCNKPINIAAL